MLPEPVITSDQAQLLVKKHVDQTGSSKVVRVVNLSNNGYSYCSKIRTFIIDINSGDSPSAAVLTIALSGETASQESLYPPNSLTILHSIISRILSSTAIPIPPSSILDTSLSLVPFPYILSPASPNISSDSIISLGEARRKGLLGSSPNDPRQLKVDLMLGRFLGEVHKNCVNDWFGLPIQTVTESTQPPTGPLADPELPNSYSWQETFAALFEDVLSGIETFTSSNPANTPQIALPVGRIRLLFSRAIGSFIFDDVEEPSLIWFTGSEDDIYIGMTASSSSPPVAAILPNLSYAIWGDPLLESFFIGFSGLPSTGAAPSEAFMEAYTSSGGSPRIFIFPRQKTKRIWYTLFLALVVLRERLSGGATGMKGDTRGQDKTNWAKQVIAECIQELEL